MVLGLSWNKQGDGGISPLQDGERRNLFLHIWLPHTAMRRWSYTMPRTEHSILYASMQARTIKASPVLGTRIKSRLPRGSTDKWGHGSTYPG